MASWCFCVIEFKDSEELATVPSPWVSEELYTLACAFPPGHRRWARQLAKLNAAVDPTWPKYPCEILYKFDTFDAAFKKERFLKSYSDFSQSEEYVRHFKKRKIRSYSSSEDEEEEGSPTPKLAPPIIITNVTASSSDVAYVSSSVDPSDNQEEHSTDKNSRDLDFAGRLDRLEKCCSSIQKDVRQILDLLQSQRNSHVASMVNLDIVENYLPLSSLSALYELESQLADSLERKEELRVHLQQLGGSSSDEMVKRILRHLFTDDLAQQFSWMGQKGKNKLCDLLLMKVVFHAVETSKIKGTREQVLKRIKDWFRHAGARSKYTERSSVRLLCY